MSDQNWQQWLRANADKLLLLLAAFAFMIYSAHFAHRGQDPELQRTALGFAGQAFAGFLALTQAARMASSALNPQSATTQTQTATVVTETHVEPQEAPKS